MDLLSSKCVSYRAVSHHANTTTNNCFKLAANEDWRRKREKRLQQQRVNFVVKNISFNIIINNNKFAE